MFCYRCNANTPQIKKNNQFWCDECGHSERLARTIIDAGSMSDPQQTSYLDSSLSVMIKLSLLIAFFPFSLLILVCIYGFDGTVQIVKFLTRDTILLALPIIAIVFLLLITIVIFNK